MSDPGRIPCQKELGDSYSRSIDDKTVQPESYTNLSTRAYTESRKTIGGVRRLSRVANELRQERKQKEFKAAQLASEGSGF